MDGKSKFFYISKSHPYFKHVNAIKKCNTTNKKIIINKKGFTGYFPPLKVAAFLSYCFIFLNSIVLPALATFLFFWLYSNFAVLASFSREGVNNLPDLLQNSVCFINDNFVYEPFIICVAVFILVVKKYKIKLDTIEILLYLTLIYQIANLFNFILLLGPGYINYLPDTDLILKMADGNIITTRVESTHPDYPRLIRYVASNLAALSAKKPAVRAFSLLLANATNLTADIFSDVNKATYWIDQWEFYKENGRLRGALERRNMPGDTTPTAESSSTASSSSSSNTSNFLGDSDSSSFLPDFDYTKILDLFLPVEHSIPLSTLINVHFISIICLFVMVFCTIFLFIYLFLNLFIINNKDYLLNKVKNKYAIWYVKYVLFRSKVDIVVLAIIILSSQCYMLYVLHYLIVHPIIIKT